MNLHDLSSHARAGHVEALNLISLEGGNYYLLEARVSGQPFTLDDGRGHFLHLRSVEHAREVLQPLPPLPPFHLVQMPVHDEMCGMPDEPENSRGPSSTH
ncbi:cation transporter [Pseudomonas sp. CrR25]|nr:cation transporter [Pseudomonas sp. CrR25]